MLLVPAALVAALLVLGLAGGFGSLGSLGQAFEGPSVPASARVPVAVGTAHRPRALPVARGTTVIAARTTLPVGGGIVGTATTTTQSQGIGATGPGHGTTGRATGPTGPSGPSGGGGGKGTGTGGSGGGSHGSPSILDNVANLGMSVTKNIPGPVGGLATQLLKSLAKTVDGVLPQAAHPAPSSPVTGLVKGLANSLHLP